MSRRGKGRDPAGGSRRWVAETPESEWEPQTAWAEPTDPGEEIQTPESDPRGRIRPGGSGLGDSLQIMVLQGFASRGRCDWEWSGAGMAIRKVGKRREFPTGSLGGFKCSRFPACWCSELR